MSVSLVFTLDRNFIQHCCVVLASIFANNKEQFDIHIIYDTPNDKKIEPLLKFIVSKGHYVKLHYFDNSQISGFKITDHITLATYYRFFIAAFLADRRRVIYLDCDIIVKGALRDLWNLDLNGNIIGAVWQENNTFNAGVMLIDLDKWRAESTTARCLAWMKENNSNVVFWDQDVLNAVLNESVLALSPHWNFMSTDSAMATKEFDQIKIIHFLGSHKPWSIYGSHPLKSEYFKYLRQTPYKDFRIPESRLRYRLKQLIKKFLITVVGNKLFELLLRKKPDASKV